MADQVTPTAQSLPLQDHVAIVAGGSRGIESTIALHLASLGAKVAIIYSSSSAQADLIVSQINNTIPNIASSSFTLDPRAIAVKADISDAVQVKYLFDTAESAFNSPINIFVNSAGVIDTKYPTLANMQVEDFNIILSVNIRGAFLCCKESANRIKHGGGGRIISITTSQVAALRHGYAAYAGSKAAVETMVKVLSKELKGTGITANCVAPGPIATELFYKGKTEEMVKSFVEQSPLGRLGQTEDVAPLVGFFASDAGEWVNGQIIRINGGLV